MNSKKCADLLTKFNEWRRGDDEDNQDVKMPNPKELGIAIDSAVELIKQRDEMHEALRKISMMRSGNDLAKAMVNVAVAAISKAGT